MSPVTWDAELRLHRLTIAPCKALVFDVTTMPHQPSVLWIEHGRLSRGCLCKVIAASLTEWQRRGRGGKETPAVAGKIGRTRMEIARPEQMKSGKIRMARDGWEAEKEEKRVSQQEVCPCWLLWLEAAADGFKRAPGSLGLCF